MKNIKKVFKVMICAALACMSLSLVGFAEGEATTTDSEYTNGHYYHIDVRVAGTFTYSYPITESETTTLTITKVWDDGDETVDHSEDEVIVYLLDSDRNRLKDSSGNDRYVTLSESNNWSITITDAGDVAYVEEVEVDGYDTTIGEITSVSETSDSTASYSTTGTVTVDKINSVSYSNSNGGTSTLNVSLYTQQKSENSDYPYEFFYDNDNKNGGRRLSNLLTTSTITINLTYTYSYVDQNGETQTGTATDDFVFDGATLTTTNTCYYKDYETTMAGYDAVITSELLTKSFNTLVTSNSITITNHKKVVLAASDPDGNDATDDGTDTDAFDDSDINSDDTSTTEAATDTSDKTEIAMYAVVGIMAALGVAYISYYKIKEEI